MKVLIIALFVLLLIISLWRLRPYIIIAREFWRFMREIKDSQNAARARSSGTERLLRCASCGVLIPASRALVGRASSAVFCSRECMGKKKAP